MHWGEKTVVILLLCPVVTKTAADTPAWPSEDFINSIVCFKTQQNKLSLKRSLPLVLCLFSPCCCWWAPGPLYYNSCTQARPCSKEGGHVGGSSAAFLCIAFSTWHTWHALDLICACKAGQSSIFSVPRLSEGRTDRSKFSIVLLQTSEQKHFDWKQKWKDSCLPYGSLLSSGRFFFLWIISLDIDAEGSVTNMYSLNLDEVMVGICLCCRQNELFDS